MKWPVVLGAFLGGAGLGFIVGVSVSEEKARAKYAEMLVSQRAAIMLARDIQAERPAKNEEDLAETGDDVIRVGGEMTITSEGESVNVTPLDQEPAKNAYHTAVNAKDTTVEMFVDGGINDYGVSYIEEEEYFEEDGRFKGQITILMDEHNPIFTMEGVPIEDWAERVGDSILVDFYNLVPPGAEPILYVRNHRTDEDYEVVREIQ